MGLLQGVAEPFLLGEEAPLAGEEGLHGLLEPLELGLQRLKAGPDPLGFLRQRLLPGEEEAPLEPEPKQAQLPGPFRPVGLPRQGLHLLLQGL